MRWFGILFFLFFISSMFSQSTTTRNTTYLPIVVHIIYSENSQNITDEQIFKQLETLNNDFIQMNENFDSTPNAFKSVAANIGIQFCLASKDENGNETTGITRTETNISEIGLTELYFESDNGGKDPWNVDQFINIWVADFGNTEILGVTPFPGEAVPKNKDGILINYKYFGVGGDHQDINRNLGKVLTHEMGHYFGLKHIWGNLGTICADDDEIDDTPLQNEPTFGCPDFPSPDECTQGNGIMYCNFMDYTNDECLSMFTEGQKNVILNTLDNFRAGLKEEGIMNCVVDVQEKELQGLEIYPNPASNVIWINFEKEEMNRKLQMYNISGILVKEIDVEFQENNLEIGDLSKGIYFFRIGQHTRKVVIY